jgi:hypothetical protein
MRCAANDSHPISCQCVFSLVALYHCYSQSAILTSYSAGEPVTINYWAFIMESRPLEPGLQFTQKTFGFVQLAHAIPQPWRAGQAVPQLRGVGRAADTVLPEEPSHSRGVHWFREVVALAVLAAPRVQRRRLLGILNTLSRDRQAQRFG